MGKRPHPAGSSCSWAGLWTAVTRTFSTSRSFQTFLKHNVGNPVHRDDCFSYKTVFMFFRTLQYIISDGAFAFSQTFINISLLNSLKLTICKLELLVLLSVRCKYFQPFFYWFCTLETDLTGRNQNCYKYVISLFLYGTAVAQWLEYRACNLQALGSNPIKVIGDNGKNILS